MVEYVMREQNVLAADEFIELFCELIVSRLSIIAKQRHRLSPSFIHLVLLQDLIILKASLVSSSALTNGLDPFLNVKFKGSWKVNNQNLRGLCNEAQQLRDNFKPVTAEHVHRGHNTEADAQASRGKYLGAGQVEGDYYYD
ncbi:hypothetical protein TSUD_281680 [Trifolium subterraneum]|uniref:RNase H type-1 domain-containing protein n=1 Tax=Trifolium subterraneum TaxID=3900 RepID=A0A2Z6M004_TRISU|nr:hypothetical protein TSUD_281680 [Trifolium subterraneum]